MIVLLFLLFLILALIDVPGLIRKRDWKLLSVYGVLFVSSLTLAVLRFMDIDVPNPLIGVYNITGNWLGLGYKPQ